MKGVSSEADDNYRYYEKETTFTGIQNKFMCIYISIWTKNQFTSRMTRSNEEMDLLCTSIVDVDDTAEPIFYLLFKL